MKTASINSLRQGIWFHQIIQGQQLTVHMNYFTGRERIWLDDDLIETKHGILFRSAHKVIVAGQTYNVEIGHMSLKRIILGEIRCKVFSGDQLLYDLSARFAQRGFMLGIFIGTLVGSTLIAFIISQLFTATAG